MARTKRSGPGPPSMRLPPLGGRNPPAGPRPPWTYASHIMQQLFRESGQEALCFEEIASRLAPLLPHAHWRPEWLPEVSEEALERTLADVAYHTTEDSRLRLYQYPGQTRKTVIGRWPAPHSADPRPAWFFPRRVLLRALLPTDPPVTFEEVLARLEWELECGSQLHGRWTTQVSRGALRRSLAVWGLCEGGRYRLKPRA